MFFPEPNVDSAILHIEIDRSKFVDIDRKKFSKFVKCCFSMRRKTLLNNLGSAYDKTKLKNTLGNEVLSRRAETFSLDEFVNLFKKCEKL
jgi:16S rRNA (adenine1518-N6/adenine1519-N6)-dimethyltransferase